MSKPLKQSKPHGRKQQIQHDLPADLYEYMAALHNSTRRAGTHDLAPWAVCDDWPKPVPVTLTEVEIFERWFDDLFAEFFD